SGVTAGGVTTGEIAAGGVSAGEARGGRGGWASGRAVGFTPLPRTTGRRGHATQRSAARADGRPRDASRRGGRRPPAPGTRRQAAAFVAAASLARTTRLSRIAMIVETTM